MAEQQRSQQQQQQPTAQDRSQAIAESNTEAEQRQIDETVPGGRYMVNGQLVNADGEAIKDSDKAEKADK
jgi:invasion protein IalB